MIILNEEEWENFMKSVLENDGVAIFKNTDHADGYQDFNTTIIRQHDTIYIFQEYINYTNNEKEYDCVRITEEELNKLKEVVI